MILYTFTVRDSFYIFYHFRKDKDRFFRSLLLPSWDVVLVFLFSAAGKLIVEGVNRVYKHMRRSQRNPQGGRLSKEMPVQISNVLLVCVSCGKATRSGSRVAADGAKERYCKKCGAATGVLSSAKK